MKLAIIEDSPTMASLWTDFLQKTSYECVIVSSESEGLREALCEEAPDIVMCRGIPRHQRAFELISFLKSDPALATARIVIASSSDERRLSREIDLEAIDGLLVGPFTRLRLLEVLGEIEARTLRRGRSRPLCVIVDDSEPVRAVLTREMVSIGFDVDVAADAFEALEVITRSIPDLALVDIEMPGKSGLELCEELARIPRTHSVPIVVVSASIDDDLMRRGFASGVVDFLRKPIEPALLTKAALTTVGRTSRPPRLGRALVLEDNVTVSSVLAKLMGDLGMSCTQCRSVAEFETWLSIAVPDLITLDLSLPDGNGLAMVQAVRGNRALDNVPVVVISGTTDRDTMVECLQSGANDYLEKPFVRDEFLARLSNLMRTKKLQDELSQKNRMLENLAYHDTLTGLLNRRSLDEGLAREINRADRKKESLGCVLIDLDNFKDINDTHGHEVGDEILREVATILRTSVRGYDLPCRYGGEELCVLLPGLSADNAARLAERLRTLCEQTPMSRLGLKQTVSIGVTAYPHPSSANSLIADADKAMYEAKRLGRNAVRIARANF